MPLCVARLKFAPAAPSTATSYNRPSDSENIYSDRRDLPVDQKDPIHLVIDGGKRTTRPNKYQCNRTKEHRSQSRKNVQKTNNWSRGRCQNCEQCNLWQSFSFLKHFYQKKKTKEEKNNFRTGKKSPTKRYNGKLFPPTIKFSWHNWFLMLSYEFGKSFQTTAKTYATQATFDIKVSRKWCSVRVCDVHLCDVWLAVFSLVDYVLYIFFFILLVWGDVSWLAGLRKTKIHFAMLFEMLWLD